MSGEFGFKLSVFSSNTHSTVSSKSFKDSTYFCTLFYVLKDFLSLGVPNKSIGLSLFSNKIVLNRWIQNLKTTYRTLKVDVEKSCYFQIVFWVCQECRRDEVGHRTMTHIQGGPWPDNWLGLADDGNVRYRPWESSLTQWPVRQPSQTNWPLTCIIQKF